MREFWKFATLAHDADQHSPTRLILLLLEEGEGMGQGWLRWLGCIQGSKIQMEFLHTWNLISYALGVTSGRLGRVGEGKKVHAQNSRQHLWTRTVSPNFNVSRLTPKFGAFLQWWHPNFCLHSLLFQPSPFLTRVALKGLRGNPILTWTVSVSDPPLRK